MRKYVRFRYLSIPLFLFLAIITYLLPSVARHILPIIVLFAGGSSNQKVFLFFIFLLAPLLTQFIFRGSRDRKYLLGYIWFFLASVLFLYVVGACLMYLLVTAHNIPLDSYFIIPEQVIDGRLAPGGIIGNFNNNQVLKYVINIPSEYLGVDSTIPAAYGKILLLFPSWVFYLSLIVLLASLYFWTRMGIQLLEKPIDFLLLSLPVYGLFVTTIDGGFFTPFALTSMGAFLSFMTYRLYKKKSFKKIVLILCVSIIPPAIIPSILLFISGLDYRFMQHVFIALAYAFLI